MSNATGLSTRELQQCKNKVLQTRLNWNSRLKPSPAGAAPQDIDVMWRELLWQLCEKPADMSAIPRGFLFMPASPGHGWQRIQGGGGVGGAPFHTAGVENADSHRSAHPAGSDDPQGPRWQSGSLVTTRWQDPLEITWPPGQHITTLKYSEAKKKCRFFKGSGKACEDVSRWAELHLVQFVMCHGGSDSLTRLNCPNTRLHSVIGE